MCFVLSRGKIPAYQPVLLLSVRQLYPHRARTYNSMGISIDPLSELVLITKSPVLSISSGQE